MDSLPIPWNRYGIIAELACRLKGASPQFGKTALQKSVYLLQALYGVDCGYDFSLYAYGPFCSDLLGDLDTTGTLGGVQVHALGWGLDGYQIEPGPRSDAIREKAKAFLGDATVQDALARLREDFGHFLAKDLELRSTIVYADRDLGRNGDQPSRDELARTVQQIKPRFSPKSIDAAIAELEGKGFLSFGG